MHTAHTITDTFVATDDLSFFKATGLRKLLFAMLEQSIKDLIADRADKHAPAEISTSARWMSTDAGHECIQFLMPDASADQVCAKIHADPEAVLQALKRADNASSSVESAGPDSTGDYTLRADAGVEKALLADDLSLDSDQISDAAEAPQEQAWN